MEHNEQPARPAQPPDGGPDDDVRVRQRIRAGDREAFGTLYDRYAKSVYGHACRLTGDLSAAEDVMSETFLAAWRTREQIDPEGGPLRPWLLGIATNKARNHRRGVGRRLAFWPGSRSRRRPRTSRTPPPSGWTTSANWPPYGRSWTACGSPSGRCWRSASGPGWTRRRRRQRWTSPSAPYAHGSPGPVRGCAAWRASTWRGSAAKRPRSGGKPDRIGAGPGGSGGNPSWVAER